MVDFDSLLQHLDFEHIPSAILVLVLALALGRLATRFLDSMANRFSGRRLWFKHLAVVSRFGILAVGAMIALMSVVRLSDQALLAVGGTLAVALGFAFKDLATSVMAGLILLFDRPFQVGDRIEFGGEYGEVRQIGLRAVRIATLDDNLVSIPNSRFLTEKVASANAGEFHQMVVLDLYIGCSEPIDLAKRLAYEAAATSRYLYLGMPITVVVREGPTGGGRGRFALCITVKAYVFDGRYEVAFGTDITERVKRAFDRHGIRTAGQLADSESMLLTGPRPAGLGSFPS